MNFNGELHELFSLHGLSFLIILSLLELVLGVDNIIFISLAINKLPPEERFKTRAIALSIAFVIRLILLFCIVLLSKIKTVIFTVSGFDVSIRDLIFFNAGIYLLLSILKEIVWFYRLKKGNLKQSKSGIISDRVKGGSYGSTIIAIVFIDLLFSFDSIFSAIGLISNFVIIGLAIGIGMICMVYISGKTSEFIEKYPSFKIMALTFMMGIGILMIAQSFHLEIPKWYLYAALLIALLGQAFTKGKLKPGNNSDKK